MFPFRHLHTGSASTPPGFTEGMVASRERDWFVSGAGLLTLPVSPSALHGR